MLMSTELYSVFVTNVRDRMQALGLSQRDLAKKLQVTEGYISQILKGDSRPGLESLDRFATALEIEPFELIRKNGKKVARAS